MSGVVGVIIFIAVVAAIVFGREYVRRRANDSRAERARNADPQ